jgi:hypothetical protein
MKVKVAIEQIIDIEDAFNNDIAFEIYGPKQEDLSDDIKVDYLINRFCEDIDYLVKYDEVRSAISVEYIED